MDRYLTFSLLQATLAAPDVCFARLHTNGYVSSQELTSVTHQSSFHYQKK